MPDHHIRLNLVNGLANGNPFPVGYYGSNNSAAFINYFSDAINGIWSNNSKYNVFRSDFTMSPHSPATTSYGIYAIGQTSAINNSISIIPNLNGDINTFSNLRHAMFTNGVESFTSIGNDVDNCTFGIKSNGAVDVKIEDNTINNFLTGIGVYDIDVRSTYNFKQILNNNLNVGIPLDQLNHYGMTGIDIQNNITHTSPIIISKNTIYNSAIGIHGRNATNLTIGIDGTDFNSITDEMPLDNTFHYGIWMENSSFARINNNEVEWTGGTVDNDAYLDANSGIGLSGSISCHVTENKITNYGGGFKILEDCSRTELHCNKMENCYHGVYFDVNGINNQFTDQGDITNQEAWKNKWVSNVDMLNHVGGGNLANQINWLYKPDPVNDPLSEYIPKTQLSNINQLPCANEIIWCITPQLISEFSRQQSFGDAVIDTIIPDPDSLEFKYNNKEAFYEAALADISLLQLGTVNDIIYQQEFTEIEQSNMGKYQEVKVHLENYESSDAIQKLSAIVDQNQKEENLKSVNSIIALQYNPEMDADSDTISILNTIAYLHPFYGGEAVFMVRAILKLNIQDQLPALRRGQHNHQVIDQEYARKGSLKPNPASNNFQFTYPLEENTQVRLLIYNTFGEKVSEQELKQNNTEINIIAFKSGVYYLHVLINEVDEESHKLIIIK